MAHGRPWYKRSATDFILGTIGMDLETRGAYSLIIDMLNDRDRPLPDDARFLAGFLGVSVRKWAVIRCTLLGDPSKLYLNGDGDLSNPRFDREREERRIEHERSVEAGRKGGKKSAEQRAAEAAQQGDLDLPETAPDQFSGSKTARKLDENGVKTSRNIGENDAPALKNNDNSEAPPQATRARKRLEARVERENNTDDSNLDPSRAPARDEPAQTVEAETPYQLTMACLDAAGMSARAASRPRLLTDSLDVVKGWITSGIDVRAIALPVIEAVTMEGGQPAHSLNYFAAKIDTRHAREKRTLEKTGAPLAPIALPVFEFDDEPEKIAQLRQAIADRIGKPIYAQWCKAVRFQVMDPAQKGDANVLAVLSRPGGPRVWTPGAVIERHGAAIRSVAQQLLGIAKVWER